MGSCVSEARRAAPVGAGSPSLPPALPYDPTCYLCPGNARAVGIRNPAYTSVFAFDNDFPALSPDVSGEPVNERGLIQGHPERGICPRSLPYSPRHDLPPARRGWNDRSCAPSSMNGSRKRTNSDPCPGVNYVQIFENHGAIRQGQRADTRTARSGPAPIFRTSR